MSLGAYLQITLDIKPENREAAAKVYTEYRQPFLNQIEGAASKNLIVRDEVVQVLHGFNTVEHANAYLDSDLFKNNVFVGLQALWSSDSVIDIYQVT
ncbi:hypothetical protein [Fundicoccus culcitae]|uniref:ABM domain-containing protein n=1 Tax=Fundicoccus culcitae TaxID=2969821 RepID=A0ABY5P579_9LACT|nr:hypothetical protein [Fundicoccus culcitae]UUX33568.1 hypothetical protein NRE15_11765 [Fundicoccus culcitae]